MLRYICLFLCFLVFDVTAIRLNVLCEGNGQFNLQVGGIATASPPQVVGDNTTDFHGHWKKNTYNGLYTNQVSLADAKKRCSACQLREEALVGTVVGVPKLRCEFILQQNDAAAFVCNSVCTVLGSFEPADTNEESELVSLTTRSTCGKLYSAPIQRHLTLFKTEQNSDDEIVQVWQYHMNTAGNSFYLNDQTGHVAAAFATCGQFVQPTPVAAQEYFGKRAKAPALAQEVDDDDDLDNEENEKPVEKPNKILSPVERQQQEMLRQAKLLVELKNQPEVVVEVAKQEQQQQHLPTPLERQQQLRANQAEEFLEHFQPLPPTPLERQEAAREGLLRKREVEERLTIAETAGIVVGSLVGLCVISCVLFGVTIYLQQR